MTKACVGLGWFGDLRLEKRGAAFGGADRASGIASKRRVLDAVARAKAGEKVREDHLTFETWEALSRLMTTKCFELLRHLHRSPAPSIAALARSLGRDCKRMHEDVEALAAAGLIARGEAGLSADYDEIATRIAL